MSAPTLLDVLGEGVTVDTRVVAVEFFVEGIPAPQGSKKAMPVRNKAGHLVKINQIESSKKVAPWRKQIAVASHNVMAGRPPLSGPTRVVLSFVLYRPKSTPKRSTPAAVKYPDVDKLTRCVFDGMGGVVMANDSQVVDVHATKRIAEIGERTGVHIRVEEHR